MRKIIGHVITTKREHREGIATQYAGLASGCRGCLGATGGSQEYSVLPIESFIDQRYCAGPPAPKNNRGKRDTCRILPFSVNHRTLRRRRGEPRIWMRAFATRMGSPFFTFPVQALNWRGN